MQYFCVAIKKHENDCPSIVVDDHRWLDQSFAHETHTCLIIIDRDCVAYATFFFSWSFLDSTFLL